MKENVEVVVKVGFNDKEMSIMTTSINNVKYSTGTCNGNIQIYHLSPSILASYKGLYLS